MSFAQPLNSRRCCWRGPENFARVQWCEFDLDNGLWYVPSVRLKRTKLEKEVGEPHFVPLSTQAVQVLEELFKLTCRSTLVFPGERHRDRPMSENTVNAALRAMGYAKDEMTAHGFRATARTLIVEALCFDEAVAEMQLTHAVKRANGSGHRHRRRERSCQSSLVPRARGVPARAEPMDRECAYRLG